MSSPPPPQRSASPRSPSPEFEAWRYTRPYRPKRPPIVFVPAGHTESTFPTAPPRISSGEDVSNLYLSLVGITPESTNPPSADSTGASTPATELCEVCSQPVGPSRAAHDRSLSHLSSLPHSHPPHALPRSSFGLKILEETGWDPDARVGLGAEGREGTRYPVKAVEKVGKLGVGAEGKGGKVKKVVAERLGAKEMRRREVEGKKRRERVRQELGGGVDWGVMYGKTGEGSGLR